MCFARFWETRLLIMSAVFVVEGTTAAGKLTSEKIANSSLGTLSLFISLHTLS